MGTFNDQTGLMHGYTGAPDGKFTTFIVPAGHVVPQGSGTMAALIDNSGEVAGTVDGDEVGFLGSANLSAAADFYGTQAGSDRYQIPRSTVYSTSRV